MDPPKKKLQTVEQLDMVSQRFETLKQRVHSYNNPQRGLKRRATHDVTIDGDTQEVSEESQDVVGMDAAATEQLVVSLESMDFASEQIEID